MDTRLLGSNLIALNHAQDGGRPSMEGGEDAYYSRNAPADGRVIRIVSAVAAVCFGFVAIGTWLQ